MGIISEQLSILNQELQNAKDSINGKYSTMDMPSIDSLEVNELSQKINDIPVLNTKDATAVESDIVKNKTAYANNQKLSGLLRDYRNATITPTNVLSGNSIKINIPEGVYDNTSSISLKFSDIASLINLNSDQIKEGEVILGITGTYSDSSSDSEQQPPELPDGKYFDITTRTNIFNSSFKWGFWELLNSGESKAYQKVEMYIRIYNVYYYHGLSEQYDGYYVGDNKDTIYSCIYDDFSYIDNALSCYIYDLGLSYQDLGIVWRKVYYDSPELIMKHAGWMFEMGQNSTVEYLFFDSFSKNTLIDYKNTCLNSFEEICQKIKSTYGIVYNGGNNYFDSVSTNTYSANQKFKIAKVIHDWLVLNNTYGQTDEENLDQTMFTALCKGRYTPVCAAYGKAFQWCCQKFGIYTLTILGDTSEGYHLWNIICYEPYDNSIASAANNPAIWNEVDVTWDDPTNAGPTYCTWEFFNTTTNYLESSYGGNRQRKTYSDRNSEPYYNYISRCSCTQYKYTGNTQYGGL